VDCNRNVRVELSDSGSSDVGAGFADILRLEEELRGQIGDSNGSGVVEGKGFDTSEGNVLGCEGLLNGRQVPLKKGRHLPISTPRPFKPTTRTFDEPMRFMASWPSTYLDVISPHSSRIPSISRGGTSQLPAVQGLIDLSMLDGLHSFLWVVDLHRDVLIGLCQ
jgi:hypothetical protein